MIAALMLGREGSTAFPGKNTLPILGRPMMVYPLLAAKYSKYVDEIFVSTDSDRIKNIAGDFGATIIDRPPHLATKEALGEDAYAHGYRHIRYTLNKPVEMVVLLFCNAPTILPSVIDRGIEALRADESLDSAVTVSVYNMWSPLRARKLDGEGLLQPFVPFELFGDPKTLNCDRDSQGDVYFADMSTSIVRPRCLENLHDGLLPQRWMGTRIFPLKQWGGLDVDYEWQVPQVEFWLRKNGFTESVMPHQPHD
jgi:hypothetical protein